MRMFVAIDCNGEKEYFRRLQGMLPRDGVKNADDFHVTLRFLGEVMPDGVEVIKGALRAVKFLPFSFSLDSIGFFPDEKTPKVVWIGIWPKEATIMLQQQIEKQLEGLFDKFNREKHFEPHITLARVKNKNALFGDVGDISVEKRRIGISDFHLMESSLTPTGSLYRRILTVPAQGGEQQSF